MALSVPQSLVGLLWAYYTTQTPMNKSYRKPSRPLLPIAFYISCIAYSAQHQETPNSS
jgi:hypothetical protein